MVATALKYTVREPRPDNSQEKNSFPSGYTTTAFAFATVVAIEHEWYWGVTAMGMAGMTIGASYGLGVYFAEKGQGRMYSYAPILDKETTGIRLVTNF